MKFKNLEKKSDKDFRRITGVKRETFTKMIEILRAAHQEKHKRGGRPTNLDINDRLLMALEYLREYRTYAHIAASYGLSESNAYQTIRWIENILIKSKVFNLPGKKALLKSDMEFEVVLIDAAETPIERPKKNKKTITPGRKKDTH